MAKKIFFLILLSSIFVNAFATHNRAGEITFKHISGYTYEITVTTITYSPSTADRNELEVSWGDGTTSTVARLAASRIHPRRFRNRRKNGIRSRRF